MQRGVYRGRRDSHCAPPALALALTLALALALTLARSYSHDPRWRASSGTSKLCGGLFFARSSAATIALALDWEQRVNALNAGQKNQPHFNAALDAARNVHVALLPCAQFPNGVRYASPAWRLAQLAHQQARTVLVHNNWIKGNTPPSAHVSASGASGESTRRGPASSSAPHCQPLDHGGATRRSRTGRDAACSRSTGHPTRPTRAPRQWSAGLGPPEKGFPTPSVYIATTLSVRPLLLFSPAQ